MEDLENNRFFCECDVCLHPLQFGVEKLHALKESSERK